MSHISGEVEATQICANCKNPNQVSITYDVQIMDVQFMTHR